MSRSLASRSSLALNFVSLWTPRLSYRVVGAVAAAIDVAAIITANIIGQVFYNLAMGRRLEDLGVASGIGLLSSVIYVALAQSAGLYRLATLTGAPRNLRRVVAYSILVCLAITAILFLLKVGVDFSRGSLIISSVVQLMGLTFARTGYGAWFRTMMVRGTIIGQPVVLIGDHDEMARLKNSFLLLQYGLRAVARVPQNSAVADQSKCIEDAIAYARDYGAKAFVIASRWEKAERLASVTDALRISPLPVRLLPDQIVRSVICSNPHLGSSLTIELQRAPMTKTELAIKRLVDILAASLALILLSPVFIAAAIAVKLDSKGPVIFKQRRNGFNQRRFVILKFRTMTVLEDGVKVTQARKNDIRVTRVGRMLRRLSIDELPQLFNVLKGDMSLVGPRPHALAHDDEYKTQISTYCMRHHVKPGITGWAQIHGFRGETAHIEQMQSRVKHDLWYINNWSLLLDMSILMRTCFEVFSHDAY